MGAFAWWTKRLPLPARRTEKIPGGTTSYRPGKTTHDTEMPWIVYHYGRTVDLFWPPWRSTRVLGHAAIECECAVCGERHLVVGRIPRFGPVPDRGEHPERVRFKLDHLHPDRPAQFAWARPLLNPHASGPLDLDALAMRLEADLLACDPAQPEHPSKETDRG